MKRALIICTFLIMISFGFSVNSSAGSHIQEIFSKAMYMSIITRDR